MSIDFQKLRNVYLTSIKGDGIGNILFYRPLATVFTGFFVAGNFSANQVTALSWICNISSAYFLSIGNFFWGILFFHLGNICDCSDGQVAIYTNTKTMLGKYFDAWGDRISYILIFGAISVEYMLRTEHYNFIFFYIFWVLLFFSNTYFEKISSEISEKEGLEVLQEKSQKFLGKFSRYIRWDGTITAIIFHTCLFFHHLEWIIFPFLSIHLVFVVLGGKRIFWKLRKIDREDIKNTVE